MANLQNSHLVDENDYSDLSDGEILDIIFDRFEIKGDNATKQLIDKIDMLLNKSKN
jgi:hypothetical protein|tara:strand:- start:633 stop:800 length:168 start_codon:yes stop_codon:yes gene_type:complete